VQLIALRCRQGPKLARFASQNHHVREISQGLSKVCVGRAAARVALIDVSRWVDCETVAKIYEAIGRLKERYPRVARYYQLAYDEQQSEPSFSEDIERKQKAESLDGSYLLKTSRSELNAEDIWRTYVLLSRVEAAFRAKKIPCASDPSSTGWNAGSKLTSYCVCWPTTCWSVLSALSWIRESTSWETLRRQLSTHQVVTVRIPERIVSPIKKWTQNSH
jgi:hypothetical protein